MAELKLRDVRKNFGDVAVIHGVDLDIEAGEFCVFVGPSGCGKSTLLRMIAGLEEISSGDISIGPRIVNDIDPSERGVAMVFQSYALYPHMTVAENMGFGLRMGGRPKAEIAERVAEAASILQLEPLLERRPKALSGGQRQRVAIGRAIVRHPDVFLFDEPLSNLDAELRVAMRVEIAKLHHNMPGATMIYVTHDQVEAMTLADKIVVLRAGIVEQVGTPLTLYDDPDNLFVAGFIGSPRMNFLSGEISGGDGGRAQVHLTAFGDVTISVPLKGDLSAGKPVTVGIRPEHFAEGGPDSLPLTVDVAEHLGGASFIHAVSSGGERMVLETRDGREARPDLAFNAAFSADRALVFDPDTNQRLR